MGHRVRSAATARQSRSAETRSAGWRMMGCAQPRSGIRLPLRSAAPVCPRPPGPDEWRLRSLRDGAHVQVRWFDEGALGPTGQRGFHRECPEDTFRALRRVVSGASAGSAKRTGIAAPVGVKRIWSPGMSCSSRHRMFSRTLRCLPLPRITRRRHVSLMFTIRRSPLIGGRSSLVRMAPPQSPPGDAVIGDISNLDSPNRRHRRVSVTAQISRPTPTTGKMKAIAASALRSSSRGTKTSTGAPRRATCRRQRRRGGHSRAYRLPWDSRN